ncbi:MAG: hypothetical protein ACLTK0_06425 [Anaerovoracaceae bacterium]
MIYDILTKYSKDELKGFILIIERSAQGGADHSETDDFKLWDASIKDILDATKLDKGKAQGDSPAHDKYAGAKLLSQTEM